MIPLLDGNGAPTGRADRGWSGQMNVHGWMAWVNVTQLAVAGLAVMLAIQQIAVWRWEGSRSSARYVAVTALLGAVVLVSNTVFLGSGWSAGWLLAVRATAIAAMTLSVLPLAGALTEYRPPRALTAAVSAVVIARLATWYTTDLVYVHGSYGSTPRYGPLSTASGLLVIVLLFSYLLVIAAHGRSDRERVVLTLGILASLMVGAVSFVSRDPATAELLTGYITLPSLAGVTSLIWMRQTHAQRVVAQFGDRQHALARLSRMALTEPLADLLLAARVAIISHVAGPIADEKARQTPDVGGGDATSERDDRHDREFVDAVNNVIAAATDRLAKSDEMVHRATHDDLTGLPNRSQIRSLIAQALAGGRGNSKVAIAFCNLDRFKTVNDAYGHPSGDEVLRLVADRLRGAALSCDVVGRFGSDEFAVICADPQGRDTVEALTDRIHSAFRHPIRTESMQTQVTASVGVIVAEPGDALVDADTLLRDAVTAMHDAKARGASTGRFRDELRTAVVYRADTERRLVGAVGRGEIVVHYQPLIDLTTGTIIGFEALARWQPGDVLIPPAEWIHVAETTELIHEIGEHVLLTAARQVGEWNASGHRVSVTVNVSARQLAAVRLDRAVLNALAYAPAHSLVIEVTESMAVDEVAQGTLRRLQERGIRIALDDFGTGYSALASVARLPIDTIKIDQSITRRINQPDGMALVSATVAIGSALGLTVVAEGVETLDQHRGVRALGCTIAQGYLYSRPVDAGTATTILHTDAVRGVIARAVANGAPLTG